MFSQKPGLCVSMNQHFGQMRLGDLAGGQALAQVGAQAAQRVDASDDSGLLGERRNGNDRLQQNFLVEVRHG